MPRTQSSSARRRLSIAGMSTALAAGIVVAAPLAANAHVGVSPDSAPAGTGTVLTFAFSHGCEGSPTTALEFDIPEGVTNVAPTVEAGWSIEVTRAANESVSRVVYTADEPVDDGLRATVDMSVRFSADLADSSVAFPVTQRCEQGETAWVEIPADRQSHDDLDAPAPMVQVGDVVEDEHGHGGHGSTDSEEHGAGDDHGDTEAANTSAVTSSDSVLPIVLGAGGLVAGLGALVISVVALRKRA